MKSSTLLTLFCGAALAALVTITALRLSGGGVETVPAAGPAAIDSTVCIAPTEYMRSHHMKMLDKWRDEAVREGERTHVTPDGRRFEKSLKTCLGCHSNNRMFCYMCHLYANVEPTCWNCHLSPIEIPPQ